MGKGRGSGEGEGEGEWGRGRGGEGRGGEYTYELHCVPDNILVWTHARPMTSGGGSIESC